MSISGALLDLILAAILPERAFDRFVRALLQVDVEREPNHEDALMHRLGQGLDQLPHLVEGPVKVIIGRAFVAPAPLAITKVASMKHSSSFSAPLSRSSLATSVSTRRKTSSRH